MTLCLLQQHTVGSRSRSGFNVQRSTLTLNTRAAIREYCCQCHFAPSICQRPLDHRRKQDNHDRIVSRSLYRFPDPPIYSFFPLHPCFFHIKPTTQ